MAYVDIATLMTIAAGQVLTAAVVQQIRDNQETHEDPPACSIKETTAQAVATGTSVALTSDEENFDNDSMHSTASNTSRITIQTAGRFLVSATVVFAANATGARALFVRKNGTTDYQMQSFPVSSASEVSRLSGTLPLVLAAGDYIECFVNQTSGGNLNVTLNDFSAVKFTR